MPIDMKWIRATPERCKVVIEEIGFGSDPKPSFYLLLVASTLIASFGLVVNSTAVIIGAMLVSPLMTPILGVALSLVRSDPKLLARSLTAEGLGVVLAITVSAVFGLMPLMIEPTHEMLVRTQPNLIDLLVAIFAGLAGAYAMVDERISPALPGVAIATAIVPPLSNTGLCLAMGAYRGAAGSFLLFMANFFSILLVASVVFIAAGLAKRVQERATLSYIKRFGIATIGFLAIAVFLTISLGRIVEDRTVTQTITRALQKNLQEIYGATLVKEIHSNVDGKLSVLATVSTPEVIDPDEVGSLEAGLSKSLGRDVELIVRNVLVKDMSATGSTSAAIAQNMDGSFVSKNRSAKERNIEIAEQVLWEELRGMPTLNIVKVDYGMAPSGPLIIASLYGMDYIRSEDVKRVQDIIRKRIGDDKVSLLVTQIRPDAMSDYGKELMGWSFYPEQSEAVGSAAEEVDAILREKIAGMSDVFLAGIYYSIFEDGWDILAEVVGPRVLRPDEVSSLEGAIRGKAPVPVRLFAWSRSDALVTDKGYASFEDTTSDRVQRMRALYLKRWNLARDTVEE